MCAFFFGSGTMLGMSDEYWAGVMWHCYSITENYKLEK